MFWHILAGSLAALAIFALVGLVFMRPLLNLLLDWLSRRLFTEPYHANLLEMVNVTAKVGPMDLAELELRAETGKPLARPFGARRVPSPWKDLFFNPVFISANPTPLAAKVDTATCIGPRAAKPLLLEIPILIGGMAWGNALSARAKMALAHGAAIAGTAANTGGGPFLQAEREAARFLIVQLVEAAWMRDPTILKQADAVEISLGHGAVGSMPGVIKDRDLLLDPEFKAAIEASGGLPQVESVLPEGSGVEGLRRLVDMVRAAAQDVPVGVKIGATDLLEAELEGILTVKPDFITIDGCEGGTHGVGAALHDNVGLPTLYALCRAERFLRDKGVRSEISLLIGGGLSQPGVFLKAMALGADALIIGTAAVLAMVHGQAEKVTPFEPPTQLVFHDGAKAGRFDPEQGGLYLARYLKACVAEMGQIAKTLGRDALSQVSRADLCCLDRELALMAGVHWAGCHAAPEDR